MEVYIVTKESVYEDENTEIIKVFDTEDKAASYVKENQIEGDQWLEWNNFYCT